MTDDVDAPAAEYHELRPRVQHTWAHLQGDYRFADRFEDLTRAAEDSQIGEAREFARRAAAIAEDGLDAQERISREMIAWDATVRSPPGRARPRLDSGRLRPDAAPDARPSRPRLGLRTMKRLATGCLILFAIVGCEQAAPTPTLPTPAVTASSGPSAPATATPTPTVAATTAVKSYLFAGEHLVPVRREVPYTVAVGRTAVEQTIAGPSPAERSAFPGLSTNIPDGTLLLGLEISDGLATVDLSRNFESGGGSASMFARLAQVVFALTQLPTVDRVAFELDGLPVTVFSGEGIVLDRPSVRADFESFLPAIFVDEPAYGATLDNPARIIGVANVFEATFLVEIRDAQGQILVQRQVMASCGTGCWGTFDVTIPYSVGASQEGSVHVYDLSPRDGSIENLSSYPVLLVP